MTSTLKNAFSALAEKMATETKQPEQKMSWADDVAEEPVEEGFTKVTHKKRSPSPASTTRQPTAADYEAARRAVPLGKNGLPIPGAECANPLDALKKKSSGSKSKRQGRKKAHKQVNSSDASATSWKEKEARIAALAWSGPAPKK